MLYKHTRLMFNIGLIFCLLVWYCCFGIVWTVRQAVPVNDIKCKLRWCKPLHGSFSSGPLLLNSDQLMTKTLSAQLRWHHWCHREPTQLFWKPDQSHQTTQSNLTLANLNFSDGACFRWANDELTKLVRLKVELRWRHPTDCVSMVTSKRLGFQKMGLLLLSP